MKLALTLALLLSSTLLFAQEDPLTLVDPRIGTKTTNQQDNGNTVPGATRPFGMLSWGPDPAAGGMYRYETPVTRGFSLMHLSGPGCGAFGDVPIFPMLGLPASTPSVLPIPYEATFSHADEVAQPGYYSVKLDSGIEVELAAAVHSGIGIIRYPAGADQRTLVLDLSRNLTHVDDAHLAIDGSHVSGSVDSGYFCGLQNRYRMFFSLRTEGQPESTGTFDELHYDKQSKSASGPRVGGYLSFPPNTKKVVLKVGVSFVSAANADANLTQEIPGWDLEKVRQEARSAWSEALGHALVKGGTTEQRKVFYTALYHSFVEPNVFSDVNGDYVGFDKKLHNAGKSIQYANFSGWDIYRSQVQLITMLMPKVGSDIAQSLVNDTEQGGGLPIWPVANDESSCMVGDPSAPVLASIYAFGGRDFDAKLALRQMIHGAEDPSVHTRLYPERPGLGEFLAKGYVSSQTAPYGSASVTLEDESADFAIASLAKSVGDHATEKKFLDRSGQWHKLFDPELGYIRPRDEKGVFLTGFKPENYDGFVEGNSAQYTWMVPFDLKGVIDAIGGPEKVNARLDAYFSQYGGSVINHGPYFYIANEPSFGNPWIYNWSGEPWKTQEVVRKTLTDLFTSAPDGEPGNDDLGATSSWVVFAHLGMFPEIPGVAGLTLNSPVFPEATLKLGDHTLKILSPGAPEKQYVEHVAVDGQSVNNWWIDWDKLRKANRVDYGLSSTPVKVPGNAPPAFVP
jgi:predicted alpha-1,2-mannosidase